MAKKITEITEIPSIDPELKKLAEADGVKFVARSPQRLKQFLSGAITLGELEGIDKETQLNIAKKGHDLLSQGKLENAKLVFTGLLALDPFDAYFHTALGSIAYQEKDLETALQHLDEALHINPFFSTARAHRGEIRLSQDNLTDAIEDLIKAVEGDPELKQPATRRANALIATIKEEMKKLDALPTPTPARPDSAPAPARPDSAPARPRSSSVRPRSTRARPRSSSPGLIPRQKTPRRKTSRPQPRSKK